MIRRVPLQTSFAIPGQLFFPEQFAAGDLLTKITTCERVRRSSSCPYHGVIVIASTLAKRGMRLP